MPGSVRRHLPLIVTAAAAAIVWIGCAIAFPGFGSARVTFNLFGDASFIGILAIGMTFVILSGGIDLSVGAVAALCGVVLAVLTERAGWPAPAAVVVTLALGAAWGAATGGIVHGFASPPFIVTLAGMFLARGLGFALTMESIPVASPALRAAGLAAVPLAGSRLPITALVFVATAAAGVFIGGWTAFGRTIYAVGGNATGARLMGLPVGRTRVLVYTLSGFCSGLAGVVFVLYQWAGNPAAGVGWELDAIAAVVIGGTLLSGGVGSVAGTFVGVVIFALIQTAIAFQGELSSWWTRVVLGALVLLFILIQKALARLTRARA